MAMKHPVGIMMPSMGSPYAGEFVRYSDGEIQDRRRIAPSGKQENGLILGTSLTYLRYWWWLPTTQGPSDPTDVYGYQKETHGAEFVYDDFIQNFTVDAWDPKEWVDLFADAGAHYAFHIHALSNPNGTLTLHSPPGLFRGLVVTR